MNGIGRNIPTNIIHVELKQLRCFIGPERLLVLLYNIRVDLFLIHLTGKHADDELIHGCVLVALLEAFQNLDCTDEDLAGDDVTAEL